MEREQPSPLDDGAPSPSHSTPPGGLGELSDAALAEFLRTHGAAAAIGSVAAFNFRLAKCEDSIRDLRRERAEEDKRAEARHVQTLERIASAQQLAGRAAMASIPEAQTAPGTSTWPSAIAGALAGRKRAIAALLLGLVLAALGLAEGTGLLTP